MDNSSQIKSKIKTIDYKVSDISLANLGRKEIKLDGMNYMKYLLK